MAQRTRSNSGHMIVLACALVAGPLHAASSNPSGTTNMLRAAGEAASVSDGDWVSASTGGLLTVYSYFVEVPSGLGALTVEVFDADVGAAGNADTDRDRRVGGAFNTSVTYSLRNPAGTVVSSVSCAAASGASPCLDNAWSNVFGVQSSPAAGHWEIRVDMGTGDDVHGYGIRAHDGTSGSGGTELPVYAHSFLGFGPTDSSTQTNTYHPWVTSGCTLRHNDFDVDGNNNSGVTLTGAAGFSQTLAAISGNNTWLSTVTNAFATDDSGDDYGVWTTAFTIGRQGGAAANFATTYTGAFNSAAAGVSGAPTAQPEANTFRLYLPTDGNGAPVKPSVEQFARYVTGPNPPTAGQTTTMMVSVRVTNPTASAITFSTSNLVSASVPGGGVVYAGSPLVSQGTVTTQPSVGGTGTISWNPGSLAAGGTAVLAYRVDVTPTGATSRMVLTGATASGTTATYVDETGNTTQSRATYTFGPLCELALTAGTATLASIADVLVNSSTDGMDYTVVIAAERNTLGYVIERFDQATATFVPVHDGILGVVSPRASGRVLHVTEPGGAFDDVVVRIVELELDGAMHTYGPFAAIVDAFPRVDEDEPAPLPPALRAPGLVDELDADRVSTPPRAEIRVSEPGLVVVELQQLAVALGVSTVSVRDALASSGVRLARDGVAVPYTVASTPQALWFVGDAGADAFDADGVYELTLVPGSQLASSSTPATGALSEDVQVMTEHEVDAIPLTAIASNPKGDFWFDRVLLAGAPDMMSTMLTLPGAGHGEATLSLRLFAATPGQHALNVFVDDALVGRTTLYGEGPATATFTMTWPTADAASVRLEIEDQPGVSVVFVDGATLTRTTRFAPGRLLGRGETVSVGDAVVVDVTSMALVQHDGTVVLPQGHEVLVADRQHAVHASVVGARALPKTTPHSDVLIVAASQLVDAAAALVDVHSDRGLSSNVVNVADVYRSYSHGRRTPEAIRALLRDAARGGVRYVVLLGLGSIDERGYMGSQDALLPVPLLATHDGLIAHDAAYADPDGDGDMDLSVGRLPFVSTAQVSSYAAYARQAERLDATLLVSDAADGEADFAASVVDVSETLPWPQTALHASTIGNAAVRTSLLEHLSAPASELMLYVGHAGLDRLSDSGLLLSSDLTADAAAASPSRVVVALSCVLNRFEDPDYLGLGETLLHTARAGAVFAPSSIARHADSEAFGRTLVAELSTAERLGDAVLRAANDTPSAAWQPYTLLGDPTQPVVPRSASAPDATGCSAASPSLSVALCVLLLSLRRRRRS